MATITFNSSTLGFTKGVGGYGNIATAFTSAKTSSSKMVDSLNSLRRSLDVAAVSTNVDTAIQHTDNAGYREKEKKSAISLAYRKMEQLFEDVGKVDNETAGIITKLKKGFYHKYRYLKPECEKGLLEKTADHLWNRVCQIGSAIEKVFTVVGKWLKDHWVELLVGVLLIAAAAVLMVLTGGAASFGAAFLAGLVKAAIGAAISGAISGTVTYVGARASGCSPKEAFSCAAKAFGDGLASGFLSGGIGYFGGAVGQAVGGTFKTFQALKYLDKGFDITSKAMDMYDYSGKIANKLWPDSGYSKFYNKLTSDPNYQFLSTSVNYCSTFFGSASKGARITDNTYMNKDGTYRKNVSFDTDKSGVVFKTDKHGKVTEFTVESVGKNKVFKKNAVVKLDDKRNIKSIDLNSSIYKFDGKKTIHKIGEKSVDVITGNNKYIPSTSSNSIQINIEGISIPQIDISSINTSVLSL